ncbi:MAG: NAD-dependent epimerase/dehydratase family protein [Myxococcales bacterium]|nr:NAD-dependent epimerase/dehydratase family protein [Myxococcales bacterium]
MKVLVMGGTSFNGLALVRELAKTGHDVTICNRGKTDAALPRGVARVACDRTDAAAVRAALGGREFDAVFDISAYTPADVELMVELFRGRTGHYLFASSTVIYAPTNLLPITEGHPLDRGPRQNGYGANKILCEEILLREWRERAFPCSIVAFSMVFGPNNIIPDREQRMFARMLQGRKVLIPGDGTTLGMVGHVDDQARAMRMMMQNPRTFGRRYNLTGDDYYSDEGYVDTIAEVTGRGASNVEKVFVPPALMDRLWSGEVAVGGRGSGTTSTVRASFDARSQQLFKLQGLVQRLAPNLHHWNRSVLFSVERLKQDTGWRPEYTFTSAVEHTWEWFVREGLDRTREFDFSFEDEILALVER